MPFSPRSRGRKWAAWRQSARPQGGRNLIVIFVEHAGSNADRDLFERTSKQRVRDISGNWLYTGGGKNYARQIYY
jgi:hypothetical protein